MAFLDRSPHDRTDPIDELLPGASFLADLRAAVTGDLEALARVPAELVSIITAIGDRRRPAVGEPPAPLSERR